MATITHRITINAMLAQFAILYTISIKNNASTYQSGVILHNGGYDNNYDFLCVLRLFILVIVNLLRIRRYTCPALL